MAAPLVLQGTCLKPSYSLRRQLLLSFGSSAFVTIVMVVTLAVLFAQEAGEVVLHQADQVLQIQVVKSFVSSSSHVAERFTAHMLSVEGALQLQVEATRDRIVGYPTMPGWERDAYVPFYDTETQRNVYPLSMPPAPLDWNITWNFDLQELAQRWYNTGAGGTTNIDFDPDRLQGFMLTSDSGTYHMQGSCNPAQTDPSGTGYYPNCTTANNNMTTGGVVQPVSTNQWLHRVTGDLMALAKPVYESHRDLLLTGVYFVNSGAGAAVWYPGHNLPVSNYTSNGCDWMRTKKNPYTQRPFGTSEEIARCHAKGQVVSNREYNPLERPWYADCVQQDDGVTWHGPFASISDGLRLVMVCRGIFDRRTNELIGAAGMDVTSLELSGALKGARLHGDASEIAIIRYDDATVFSDTMGLADRMGAPKIYETNFISKKNFDELRQKVNFYEKWDTVDELQKAMEESYIVCKETGVYTAFPIPMPLFGQETSRPYRPKFLVLHSVSNEVFSAVDAMDEKIAEDYVEIAASAGSLGAIGMVLVFCIVWFVSRKLTEPLLWIEKISWSILNHEDERANDVSLRIMSEDDASFAAKKFFLSTEITQLVSEFNCMLNGFSGSGASCVAMSNLSELVNGMTWRSEFQQLYSFQPQKRKSFRSRTAGTSGTSKTEEDTLSDPSNQYVDVQGMLLKPKKDDFDDEDDPNVVHHHHHHHIIEEEFTVAASSIVPAPLKKNLGANIIGASNDVSKKNELEKFSTHQIRSTRSSLFWWILVLIAIPLALTNALIIGVVSYKMVGTVPDWVTIVEQASMELEIKSLNATAVSKAEVAADKIHEVVRDLHLLTRMAGWLFFGGVQRSNAFCDMDEATEDCKTYTEVPWQCPFFESGRAECPCDWEDLPRGNCTNFTGTGVNTRDLLRRHWHIQARDADPVTGARTNATSYPQYDFLPNETLWFNTTDDLPGNEKGADAAGFETTYDRIRTSSAMAVADFPVYNYLTAVQRQKHAIGLYLGLEADGCLTGFDGCDYDFVSMARWRSTEKNRAAEIAPNLCPLGKYGYDSRCRDWYATGRQLYHTDGRSLHLTAPYLFAGGEIAASATSPIVNPQTNDYVGQALLDFTPDEIRDAIRRLTRQPISFVITPESDRTGGDTLIGPDKHKDFKGWQSANITHLLFSDEVKPENTEYFEREILPLLKAGKADVTEYRHQCQGEAEERMVLAYHPVRVESYLALRPDDFGSSINVSETLAYSVGIAIEEAAMRRPFDETSRDAMEDLERLRVIYIFLVLFISVLFTVFTCLITVSITRPMITLLRVVRTINSGEIKDELPPLQGGSREVHQVYNSFSKLIKIIRMSNIAFFSGNLTWAHDFILDALKLFRKIDDQKAIGIACNNLGNTLYAMIYEARSNSSAGLDQVPVDYETAISYFNEAVDIAQHEFDEATGENEKALFAQQMADRLFNRALFGLLAEDCGIASGDAKTLALEDLERVRHLDYDVKDLWLERKLLLKNSGVCFSRLLRRIHGLLDFYEDEDVRSLWDPKDLVEEADQILFAAWNEKTAPLFEQFTPVGRLQQLEGAAMRLDHLLNRKKDAARLAMRIFSEDEYILECAFTSAAEALLELMRDEESDSWALKTKFSARQDLRKMLKACKNRSVDLGKSVVVGLEINERFEGDPLLEQVQANCVKLYDSHCSADDHFGLVTYTVRGDLNVELGLKAENYGRQRAVLDLATTSTSDRVCPALPYAVQMVVDSAASTENDSYIVLIADGYSWDPATYMSVRRQIDRLNRERSTTIHVLILGLDVEEEETVEEYKQMCNVSRLSLYADITSENIDSTFDMIGGIISGRALNASCFQSLTMEKL